MITTEIKSNATGVISANALLQLMHLVSPSLPTGGFAYSQGLEWAVEAGWIMDDKTLAAWLAPVLETAMSGVDVPLFFRLYHAVQAADITAFGLWVDQTLAFRETSELRMEETNRGRALAVILRDLGLFSSDGTLDTAAKQWYTMAAKSQVAGFALASAKWDIPSKAAAAGYVWAWLENQVVTAVKLIPLGQTQGQKVLGRLLKCIDRAVAKGMAKTDPEIGGSLPALAIGSSRHEVQYTRLFRS